MAYPLSLSATAALAFTAIALISGAPERLQAAAVTHFAHQLEQRIQPAEINAGTQVTGIVILGGTLTRMTEGIALARKHPNATVILSGPSPDEIARFDSADDVRHRLIIDTRPHTTYENAVFTRDLVKPRPGDLWLVVTSAIHMPRSMGAFHNVGFIAQPWPVHDTPKTAHQAAPWVKHELLGLAYYRAVGRIPALWPQSRA